MVQISLAITTFLFHHIFALYIFVFVTFYFTQCIEFLILAIIILVETVSPYEIRMLAGVNKEAKHLHPTDTHPLTHLHVTEYLPPPHHHLQPFHFSSLSFPSSPSVHCGCRRSFAFVAMEGKGREGKVRPSPLLCLLLSFLSSVPPPYFCSSYRPPSLVLPLTYSNRSGVE